MSGTLIPPGEKPLIGSERTTIDEKGRILIPKKKRDRLGAEFAMTLGTNGGLVVYPSWAWLQIQHEVSQVPATNFGREDYARLLFGEAEDEFKFDPQGRLVVPQRLRQLTHLKTDVYLIGAFDRLEIWDVEEYERFQSDREGYGNERRKALVHAKSLMDGAPV